MLELAVGLLVTAGLAPVVRAEMLKHAFLDFPSERSSHSVPTPRAGGLACLAGVAAAAVVGMLVGHHLDWAPLIGAFALSLVGLADDRADVPAFWRLLAQSLVGAAVGAAVGGLLLLIVGLVLFPAVVNATNFMDGINGISGLSMSVWGLSTYILGVRSHQEALAALGGMALGSAVAFLPFNAPRARLFLGDVGSYLFGGLAAGSILLAWALHAPVTPVIAPLAIYAVDTATVLMRRLLRGAPLTQAHREHVYQRLTSGRGLPHLSVAAWSAGVAAAVTLSWWLFVDWVAVVATVLLCAVYLGSPVLMNRDVNHVG